MEQKAALPYQHQEYPKWMYSKKNPRGVIVQDLAEQEALGKDWQDHREGLPAGDPMEGQPRTAIAPADTKVADLERQLAELRGMLLAQLAKPAEPPAKQQSAKG